MIYWEQLKSILFHKWHVLKAGLMIGGIPLWRLIIHDWSKFSPVEFIDYSRYKYGIKDKSEWAKAWLHHLHRNPHHPEHWLLLWQGDPEFYSGLYQDVAPFVAAMPIPEVYVREMAADFMATSKEKTGSYNIDSWICKNGVAMPLHPLTIRRLNAALYDAGCFVEADNWPWKDEPPPPALERWHRVDGQVMPGPK